MTFCHIQPCGIVQYTDEHGAQKFGCYPFCLFGKTSAQKKVIHPLQIFKTDQQKPL